MPKVKVFYRFKPNKKTAFASANIFTYWFLAFAGAKYQVFIIKTQRRDATILVRRRRIWPDEANAFLVNAHPKCSLGTRMQPLAQTDHRHYTCEKYSLSLLKHGFGIMPRVAPGRALNPWRLIELHRYYINILKWSQPFYLTDRASWMIIPY